MNQPRHQIHIMLKTGSVWTFTYYPEIWLCLQRKHTYQLFFHPRIWIGRRGLYEDKDGVHATWYTVEREIGAVWPDGTIRIVQEGT